MLQRIFSTRNVFDVSVLTLALLLAAALAWLWLQLGFAGWFDIALNVLVALSIPALLTWAMLRVLRGGVAWWFPALGFVALVLEARYEERWTSYWGPRWTSGADWYLGILLSPEQGDLLAGMFWWSAVGFVSALIVLPSVVGAPASLHRARPLWLLPAMLLIVAMRILPPKLFLLVLRVPAPPGAAEVVRLVLAGLFAVLLLAVLLLLLFRLLRGQTFAPPAQQGVVSEAAR
jgi:hypothetical protein